MAALFVEENKLLHLYGNDIFALFVDKNKLLHLYGDDMAALC